jgi:hypothetical protein
VAARIYETQFTVPAGTPQSAPVKQAWVTEDNTIVDIELEVPPGHNGLTGIRVVKGDTALIPYNPNAWIVANDYSRVFPVNDYIPTGDISVQGFNTGQYNHTFYLRMTMQDYNPTPDASVPSALPDLPTGDITSAPDPLSPDAILGSSTVAALSDGSITADDLVTDTTGAPVLPGEPSPPELG